MSKTAQLTAKSFAECMASFVHDDNDVDKRSSMHRALSSVRERVHARIAAVQRQHPRVSIDEAREHVLRANPDLARVYWDSEK
jgi:2-oxo-4-hydroxy-4-carboxy--5-ureidoimidazoline (OHCU) decarboxylase